VQAPTKVIENGNAPNNHDEATQSGPEAAENPAGGFQIYHVPSAPTDTNDDHPPMIALKNRWAYSALKYWVKGKTFYFITTQGDHMQVPVAQVERVYPGSKPHRDSLTTPGAEPAIDGSRKK
jgi:hypothetical protein